MPKTSESPTDTRKRSAESAAASRSCSTTMADDTRRSLRGPATLREVLSSALRRHLVAGIGRQDLRDQVRVLRVLRRLHDEAGLHRLMIALAHEEWTFQPLVRRVLPGLDHLLDVGGGPSLLDRLGQPLQALVSLAVEHVGVDAVHGVEAFHEVAVLRRVDGEGVATRADRPRHGLADRLHVLELEDFGDELHLTGESELERLLEKDRRVLSGQRHVARLGARLLDLGDVTRKVFRPDRGVILADDFFLRGGDLLVEGADAVAAPRVVAAQPEETLHRRFREVEAATTRGAATASAPST